MIRLTCKAVLFDLDGVLADSTAIVDRVWREWAAERDLDGDALMSIAHGRPAAEVIAAVAPRLSVEEEVRELERREADASGVAPIAGAMRLLASLPERSWAVVTSGTAPLAASRLRAIEAPEPPLLITADDVRAGKPNPEGYLKAAQSLGAAPAECVVIEDSPAGVEAGRAGGMAVIGVTTTFPAESLAGATAVVPSLEAVILETVAEEGDGLPTFTMRVDALG
ncbi:MAG: HAD-IA family hydrolase [Actinomycetota bacterium]|nr:HAD-IA family hydrolase [Actinomycetota bacterium]